MIYAVKVGENAFNSEVNQPTSDGIKKSSVNSDIFNRISEKLLATLSAKEKWRSTEYKIDGRKTWNLVRSFRLNVCTDQFLFLTINHT